MAGANIISTKIHTVKFNDGDFRVKTSSPLDTIDSVPKRSCRLVNELSFSFTCAVRMRVSVFVQSGVFVYANS